MKKKFFVFITIISLLLICATLTACKKHTHTFDTKDTSADFLATEATCTKKATYYKSCTCGEKGTETFEYGQLAEHTKSNEIKKNASHHWYECTAEGCLAKIEESAHTVDDYNVWRKR